MRVNLRPVVTASLIFTFVAVAAEETYLKDGLWSIHSVSEITRNGTVNTMDITMQRCQKRATAEQVMNMPNVKDCKMISKSASGDAGEGSCTINGTGMTVKTSRVKKSEDEIHSVVETAMNPPMGGISAMKMTADMNFIGACPSDMQPGDVRKPDGTILLEKAPLPAELLFESMCLTGSGRHWVAGHEVTTTSDRRRSPRQWQAT